MLTKFVKNKRVIALFPFMNSYDKVKTDNPFDFTNEEETLTGFQRLKNLFRKDPDNPIHPEIAKLVQNATVSFICGGAYGAVITSRYTFIDFIEKNEATQFLNHLDAKRKLSDKMIMSFIKGFGRWGTKVCLFCTAFTATQLILSTYQNKYAWWHYSAAGASAGAVYKFQLGPKGMIAGAIFGSFFGSLYGTMKILMLKLTNRTEEDLLELRHEWRMTFDRIIRMNSRKSETEDLQKELQQAMLDPKNPVVKS